MKALRFDSHTFYEDNPDWFAFETRLRDMMLAMIEPIIRKSLHDTTHVAKVMNNQDYQKGKVDEFEFLVQKVMKKQTFQDDMQKKQEEQDLKNQKKETHLHGMIEQIKSTQNNINETFRAVKQERQ